MNANEERDVALGALAALALLCVIGAIMVMLAPTSQAASTAGWTQPYGGCKEARLYPRSQGAIECRRHGWIIRPRLIVSPARWVRFTSLPHCRFEDGSGQASACTWNVGRKRDGNGRGRAYWVDEHDRIHYVRGLR